MSDSAYLFDNAAAEAGQRFDALAALFNPTTFRHLEQLGLDRGWLCWEVGAGGPTVSNWLASRVRPTGSVLATDINTSWVSRSSIPMSRSGCTMWCRTMRPEVSSILCMHDSS
jgi:hypothetical protein